MGQQFWAIESSEETLCQSYYTQPYGMDIPANIGKSKKKKEKKRARQAKIVLVYTVPESRKWNK